MAGERIVVIEDDATIGHTLLTTLDAEGHDVMWFDNASDGVEDVMRRHPALVLLDLGLPDRDGIDVCRQLRSLAPDTRIIVVTARAEEADAVVGLDAGADDYVTKPFGLEELLARVRSQLRRTDTDAPSVYRVGDVLLDRSARRVSVDGDEVVLRAKEFDLLELLMREAGKAISRERIMEEVWDEHWFGSTKTLDMHILTLRRKLDGTTLNITTLRNIGYRLDS
jgi:DNA-binding response OmpR family regulator